MRRLCRRLRFHTEPFSTRFARGISSVFGWNCSQTQESVSRFQTFKVDSFTLRCTSKRTAKEFSLRSYLKELDLSFLSVHAHG